MTTKFGARAALIFLFVTHVEERRRGCTTIASITFFSFCNVCYFSGDKANELYGKESVLSKPNTDKEEAATPSAFNPESDGFVNPSVF